METIKFLDLRKITASYEPDLSEAVQRVIKSGWYLLGEEVGLFEKEYAEFIGTKHCIGVGNGLDALRLILRAYIELGIMKPGDEVIVPSNTFIATILAVTENHLIPVLVEPDISTYNLDISLIEKHITGRTKAIMVVHLYGRACWSDELIKLAKKYDLKIIEDNAQAAGAQLLAQGAGRGAQNKNATLKRTGSLGHAAGHSFYPGKNLGALGDGGTVTTDNDDLALIIRAIANYGSSQKYIHDYKGLNSRMDEIQAAVLRVKLPRLDVDNRSRREIAQFYHNNITNPEIILPCSETSTNETSSRIGLTVHSESSVSSLSQVWHLFVIRHNSRNKLQKYLENHGIQTLVHYPIPPYKQLAYQELTGFLCPISDKIHNEVLSIPISQLLKDFEVEKIVRNLNKYHLKTT